MGIGVVSLLMSMHSMCQNISGIQQIPSESFFAPLPGMFMILEHIISEVQSTEDVVMEFRVVLLLMYMHSM
jgi:hypothetical protein